MCVCTYVYLYLVHICVYIYKIFMHVLYVCIYTHIKSCLCYFFASNFPLASILLGLKSKILPMSQST